MNLNEFLAGSVAGCAQVASSHPLDTLKVKLQLYKHPSTLDCIKTILKQDGIRGFYTGLLPPLMGASLINAVLFSSYAFGKSLISLEPKLSLPETAYAGGIAGVLQSFVASPIELLKIRLQASGGVGRTTLTNEFQKIYNKSGVIGMYRGLYMTILREIPGYAGFYTGFEAVKRYQMSTNRQDQPLSLLQLMLAGSCGGMSYWLACYPLDVIKSKIQSQPNVSPTLIANVKEIVAKDGWRGLTRGFSVCMVRSIPAAAATFSCYELSINFLEKLY